MRGGLASIVLVTLASVACADSRPRAALDDGIEQPDPSVPRLPRAQPRRAFPTDGVDIVITRNRVTLDGNQVASITEDRVTADEVAHHTIAALAQRLRETPSSAPIVIHADELTRFGAVIDAMYTAHGIDRDEFAIAVAPVASNGTGGVITVAPPRTWDHDLDEREYDLACVTFARVGDATVTLASCDGKDRRFAIDETDAMRRHLEAQPSDRVVQVVADRDVRWSTVVRVIDALGGPPWDHAAIDAGTIRPRHVVLDLDPRIPWRAGEWDELRVRLERVELVEYADRVRERAALELRAAAMLPALERCLRGSDELRLRVPERISIVLATHPELGDVAFTGVRADPECAAALVAPPPPRIVDVLPGDAELHFAIDVPPE